MIDWNRATDVPIYEPAYLGIVMTPVTKDVHIVGVDGDRSIIETMTIARASKYDCPYTLVIEIDCEVMDGIENWLTEHGVVTREAVGITSHIGEWLLSITEDNDG